MEKPRIIKNRAKILSLLFLMIIGIVGISGCRCSSPSEKLEQQETTLTVLTPPDPNSIPLLLLRANEDKWLSENGLKVKLEIKLAPAGDPSAMKAMIHNKQADIGLFSNIGLAKLYSQGEKHVKLIGVHVWRGVYILTRKDITDWKQLDGKKGIAVPAVNTPPHLWGMKVLRKHNVNVQFVGMGMGQVLFTTLSSPDKGISVVVAPEPAVTMILMKQKKENWPVKYKVFADIAREINPNGAPLGAMAIINDTFANSENGRRAIDTFVKGYTKAINEVNNKAKVDVNSKILASEWKKVFHQDLPPQFFKTLLLSNKLGLDFKSSKGIKGELLKFYEDFGIRVDDGFFYL